MILRHISRTLALASALALAVPAFAADKVVAVAAGVDFSLALAPPSAPTPAVAAGVDFSLARTATAATSIACPDGTQAATADQCAVTEAAPADGSVLAILTGVAGRIAGDSTMASMLAEAAAWSFSPGDTFVLNTGKESIDSCFWCP